MSTTIISGNSVSQTLTVADSDTTYPGNDDTISISGQSNTVTLNGTADTLSLSGDYGTITANGPGDVISMTGQDGTVVANGTNEQLTLTGTGITLSAGIGNTISLGFGTHVIISGGAQSVSEIGGANVTFNGGPVALSAGGSSDINTFNGDHEIATLLASATANTLTVNGQYAQFNILGGGNTIVTNGLSESINVSGSNNVIDVNGASGNSVTLANYNNLLDIAGGTNVTFANASGGTITGGGTDTITIASHDNATLIASGFTTSVDGNTSAVDYQGAYGYVYIDGDSNSVTITGNNNTATEAGSDNTLILSGLAAQISVSGTSQTLEVNNATIDAANGSTLTLATGSGSLYSNGNILEVGTAASIVVQGSGNSNNWLQLSSGDTVSLSGLGDGVTASGTGNSIAFASDGGVALVSGSTLSVASSASLDLTGANNSVTLGPGAGLTVTGAGNRIASVNGGTVSVSGSGDSLTLSNGTISLTGSGNVTATKGTGFAIDGFAMPSDTQGAYNNAAATASLAALKATGANSVQLVVTAYVTDTLASSISTLSGTGLTTESNANLIAEIDQAKADGLSVFLAPHINIDDGTWQAYLNPSNPAAFFSAYQAFILNYATIAQETGVSTFSIGDELSTLDQSQYLSYWTSLITAVRAVYTGTLTYDSAWNGTSGVSFWSQLDEIGANAYVPLTDNITDPTLAQMEQGLTTVNAADSAVTGGVSAIQYYENLAAQYGKKVLFTEVGFQSVNGTNTLTGAIPPAGSTYVDYQQQALAEQALLTVLNENAGSWFQGLYIWDWNPQPTQVETDDFSPQGKPALAVIEAWYQGTEPAATGLQSGTLSGNANQVALGDAVTLGLSGTGNVVTLGSDEDITATGSGNLYEVSASQLAGETIAGSGTDTLVVAGPGSIGTGDFLNISGISAIDLPAGTDTLTLSDALVTGALGATLNVVAGSIGTAVLDATAVAAGHSVHLFGSGSDVTLTVGAGNAMLTGGTGTDVLIAGASTATLIGTGSGSSVTGTDTGLTGAVINTGTEILTGTLGGNLHFSGTGSALIIGAGASLTPTAEITGFAAAETIFLEGVTGTASFNTATEVLSVGGTKLQFAFVSPSQSFSSSAVTVAGVASTEILVTGTAECFLAGTRIMTAGGAIAVEGLAAGDLVLTQGGKAEPIIWIGQRAYAARFAAGNDFVRPVCIQADAIADGVPSRDLYVSPGHGIFIDGVLVPAWRLVNGRTVTQPEIAAPEIRYFHIELASHEVILAEDCPAESYLDIGTSNQFQNAASRLARNAMPPLPRVESGTALQAIKARLNQRAGLAAPAENAAYPVTGYVDHIGPDAVSGWVLCFDDPETPVSVEVYFWLNGTLGKISTLANVYRGDLCVPGLLSGCHGFEVALPEGATGIRVLRAIDRSPLDLLKAMPEKPMAA